MITVTIMKKKKKLRNLGGNIPGGNSPGGSLTGGNFPSWNFPGGSFHGTEENICEEFSSVHALTLVFIRKIFILQTHSLRV